MKNVDKVDRLDRVTTSSQVPSTPINEIIILMLISSFTRLSIIKRKLEACTTIAYSD